MKTVIALFRGINVGGRNLLPMKELTTLIMSLGCVDVSSYIQSGNILLRCDEKRLGTLAATITVAIENAYGFKPALILLDVSGLQTIVEDNPWGDSDGKFLHYYFLESQPDSPDLDSLAAIALSGERFKLGVGALYLRAPDGIGRSKLAARIERCMGVSVTARNSRTVTKLLSLASAMDQ